jgi:hypothetical protein
MVESNRKPLLRKLKIKTNKHSGLDIGLFKLAYTSDKDHLDTPNSKIIHFQPYCSILIITNYLLLYRYKDVVECERIVVIAFKTPHEVASFRAAKLSDDFYHMKAEFERTKTNLTQVIL